MLTLPLVHFYNGMVSTHIKCQVADVKGKTKEKAK